MTEEIIIDKEDKTKKHRNNEIDCLHFCCRKGENGKVLFWCDFYDDHCDNYTGCYYRKYLRLEQENKELKEENIKVKKEFNNLIVEIISDTEYTGEIACNGESPKEHLKQCQKALAALEEIRTYLDTLTSIDSDFTNTETYLRIQDKINEVLNLS